MGVTQSKSTFVLPQNRGKSGAESGGGATREPHFRRDGLFGHPTYPTKTLTNLDQNTVLVYCDGILIAGVAVVGKMLAKLLTGLAFRCVFFV